MNLGYVYLLFEESDGKPVYKIGITKNEIDGRLGNLSTGNSDIIDVIHLYKTKHYKKLEAMLHMKFGGVNKKGEWFHLTDEQVINFKKTCDELNETIDYLTKVNPFYKN